MKENKIRKNVEKKKRVALIGVPKTCAKGVQSVFKAPVMRVELIRNVYDTRLTHVELEENFFKYAWNAHRPTAVFKMFS